MTRGHKQTGGSETLSVTMPYPNTTPPPASGNWIDGLSSKELPTTKPAGETTVGDFYVTSVADLAQLAYNVNKKINVYGDYEGLNQKKIVLTTNLDLQGKYWTPIGIGSTPFRGAFDGNGHTITNMTVDNAAPTNSTTNKVAIDYQGLFGNAQYDPENINIMSVSNLEVTNSLVKGGRTVGGIIAFSSGGKISNCTFSGEVSADSDVSGISGGSPAVIDSCINYGDITSKGSASGVVDYAKKIANNCQNYGVIKGGEETGGVLSMGGEGSKITNCTNYGEISASGKKVGGIAGTSAPSGEINDCINRGKVTSTSTDADSRVGGIAGYAYGDIKNSSNFGTVSSGGGRVGGIAGYGYDLHAKMILNCSNSGAVTGNGDSVGGIVGYQVGLIIQSCKNSGAVKGKQYVGGIVGMQYDQKTLIENCSNIGIVEGTNFVGGIAGHVENSLALNCSNSGGVVGVQNVGGLVGEILSQDVTSIFNSYNTGTVKGQTSVGGLVGNCNSSTATAKVKNSYSVGEVTRTAGAATSVGKLFGTVTDSSPTTLVISGVYYPQAGALNYGGAMPSTGTKDRIVSIDANRNVTYNSKTVTLSQALNETTIKDTEFGTYKDFEGNPLQQAAWSAIKRLNNGFPVLNIYNGNWFDGITAVKELPTAKPEGETATGDFYISSEDELSQFSYNVKNGTSYQGKTIVLSKDLELRGKYWTAIGTETSPFKGIFNGNGHTISVLKIGTNKAPIATPAGLFGVVDGGKIINVSTKDIEIYGTENVGAIAGKIINNAEILNTYSSGALYGTKYVGGIVGYAAATDVSKANKVVNCYSIAEATASGNLASASGGTIHSGGIAGILENSILENCFWKVSEKALKPDGNPTDDLFKYNLYPFGVIHQQNMDDGTQTYGLQPSKADKFAPIANYQAPYDYKIAMGLFDSIEGYPFNGTNVDEFEYKPIVNYVNEFAALYNNQETTPSIEFTYFKSESGKYQYPIFASKATDGDAYYFAESTLLRNHDLPIGDLENMTEEEQMALMSLKIKSPTDLQYLAHLINGRVESETDEETIYVEIPYPRENGGETVIETIGDYVPVSEFAEGYFSVANDVDMTGKQFTPIGTETNPFRGFFTTSNKGVLNEISGISYTAEISSDLNFGLFGVTKASWDDMHPDWLNSPIFNKVKVSFADINITKASPDLKVNFGGLVGKASDTMISEVTVSFNGVVNVDAGNLNLGGIFGKIEHGNDKNGSINTKSEMGIDKASATFKKGLNATVKNADIGLIYGSGYGTVLNCEAFANEKISVNFSGTASVGGLVGNAMRSVGNSTAFMNSFESSGAGTDLRFGGVVGTLSIEGTATNDAEVIANNFALVETQLKGVTTSNSAKVGSLVGYLNFTAGSSIDGNLSEFEMVGMNYYTVTSDGTLKEIGSRNPTHVNDQVNAALNQAVAMPGDKDVSKVMVTYTKKITEEIYFDGDVFVSEDTILEVNTYRTTLKNMLLYGSYYLNAEGSETRGNHSGTYMSWTDGNLFNGIKSPSLIPNIVVNFDTDGGRYRGSDFQIGELIFTRGFNYGVNLEKEYTFVRFQDTLSGMTQNITKLYFTKGTVSQTNPQNDLKTDGVWKNVNDETKFLSTVEGEVYNIPKNMTENYSFILTWSPDLYQLTLQDGATADAENDIAMAMIRGKALPTTYVNKEGATVPIPTPTKVGNTFGGYYTAANGGGTQLYAADMTPNSSIVWDDSMLYFTVAYAKWTPAEYTITYNDKGGVAFSGTHGTNPPTTHTHGTPTTLVNPTKVGYTFMGWFTDSECTEANKVTTIAGDAYTADFTLYADFKVESYNFKFASGANGGVIYDKDTDTLTILENKSFDFGTTLTLPTLVKSGYTFDGWFKEANFATKLENGSIIADLGDNATGDVIDIDAFAKFTATSITGATTDTQTPNADSPFEYIPAYSVATSITSVNNADVAALQPITFTYSLNGALPTGLSFDSATGKITGTPTVAKESKTVTLSVTASNGETTACSMTITVALAAPTFGELPTIGGITYGQTLGSATITGGKIFGTGDSSTRELTGTWAFKNATTVPNVSDSGVTEYEIIFTPSGADAAMYGALTTKAKITVTKADGTASVTLAGWTYGGTANTPVPVSATNGVTSVTYLYKVAGAGDSTYVGAVPTNAGSYTLKATFAATENYNEVSATADFTIAKANIVSTDVTAPTVSAIIEGQLIGSSTITDGSVIFNGTTVEGTFAWKDPTLKMKAAGTPDADRTFAMTFTPTGDDAANLNAIDIQVVIAHAEIIEVTFIRSDGDTFVQKVVAGSLATKPSDPTKAGFTFIGWANSEGTAFDFSKPITVNTTITASWLENQVDIQHTVSYIGSSGGQDVSQTVADGDKAENKDPGTIEGKSFAGWYSDATFKKLYDFDASVKSDLTLYAKWVDKTADIEITFTGGNGVTDVKLMAGSAVYSATNGIDSTTFSAIPLGTYNLVSTRNNVTVTTVIELKEGGANITVAFPTGSYNSKVEVSKDAPEIVVGDIDKLFDENETKAFTEGDFADARDAGATLEAKLVIEKLELPLNEEAIKQAAGKDVLSLYLDVSLRKTVSFANGTVSNVSNISETDTLITINIPLDQEIRGMRSYSIYRFHNGAVDKITSTANADGEVLTLSEDKTSLTLKVKKFSDYALGYSTSSGSSGQEGISDEEVFWKHVENELDAFKKDPMTINVDGDYKIPKSILEKQKENNIEITINFKSGSITITKEMAKNATYALDNYSYADLVKLFEKPSVTPTPPIDPVDPIDPVVPTAKNTTIFNLIALLALLVLAVLAILKKKNVILPIGLFAAALLAYVLTDSFTFASIAFVNLWSILFVALLAASIYFVFIAKAKKDDETK